MQTIRNLFVPIPEAETERIVPAPSTRYAVRPLTAKQLKEVLRLNIRCFKNGDNYTKHTFAYLLNESKTLSYRAVTLAGETVGFIFVMINENGAAHLTTIGVAPEHRRRGLARMLLDHMESALRNRKIGTVVLEVRVGNADAQRLYREKGFTVVQRIAKYYSNGEDCFLMMKALV